MYFRKGQVTVLALLLGLLALAVSLSVASRSLSDLRSVAVVDQGTKALAAAEAGVQYALNRLSAGDPTNCSPSTSAPVGGGVTFSNISGVTYNICSNTDNYAVYSGVLQDDVVQVDISGQACNVKALMVLWQNPNVSMEVIKIAVDHSSGVVSSTRYLYNGTGIDASYLTKIGGNNFAPSVRANSGCIRTSDPLCANNEGSAYDNGSCAGLNGEIPYSCQDDKFLRVKPLYGSTDVAVCNSPAGQSSGNLSVNYYQITAIATSSGNVTKKVRTSQVSSFLPAMFDSVFYSGGSLTK